MADISWINALTNGGGSSGSTSDYDSLTNRPVTNISGQGIVINALTTGVYNIDGTWKITEDDAERTTMKDDLFYVSNDENGCKLTWVTASGIHLYSVAKDAAAEGIQEDTVASAKEVVDRLVGDF